MFTAHLTGGGPSVTTFHVIFTSLIATREKLILLSAGHKTTAADHPHPTFSPGWNQDPDSISDVIRRQQVDEYLYYTRARTMVEEEIWKLACDV